jgi:hypothetical protein
MDIWAVASVIVVIPFCLDRGLGLDFAVVKR